MREISTSKAPSAVGPYSQAIVQASHLFVSGQLGLDPQSGDLVSSSAPEQMAQCLANIRAIAEAAGTDISKTVKTTVMVTNLAEFAAINQIYSDAFFSPFPARATFEVRALPKGAAVAVDAIISMD